MCIDFDEHHSGGSSFDYVIRCGPYPQVPVGLKKKKNPVKSPSLESRIPETGSDPPIGSGRDSGRDTWYCILERLSHVVATSTHGFEALS